LENEGWVRVAFDELDEKTNRRVAIYTTTNAADERIRCAGGIVAEHWKDAVLRNFLREREALP